MKKIQLCLILALGALFLAPASIVHALEVNVTWTDLTGVSVNGNSITDTALVGWGNSGAASTTRFSGNGGVKFIVAATSMDLACGLSPTNFDAHFNTMAYAVVLSSENLLKVYESGVLKGTFGTYKSGDILSVERSGTTIFYKKNGTSFYASSISAGGSLLADCALSTPGATIKDAKIFGITSAVPDPVNNLTVYPGESRVELNWIAPSDNGSAITRYEVQYDSVSSGTFTKTFIDDAVPGAVISGLANGTSYQFRVIARNALGASPASNVVTAIPKTGAELNVIWTNLVGVTASGNTITKTGETFLWDSGAVSTVTFSGNGGVDFTVAQTNADAVCGLAAKNTDASYLSINYALWAKSNGQLAVLEKGELRGNFVSYQAGDQLKVERIGTTVFYKKNGVVFYTSLIPSQGQLMVDSSINTLNGTISRAKIVGLTPGVAAAINTLVADSGVGQVSLLWDVPANNGAVIVGYDVQYGRVTADSFSSLFKISTVTPGAQITGLTSGIEYQFRVIARNAYGSSVYSNVVTAVPMTGSPVTWTKMTGVSAVGNTLTKTAATVGWDSGASSTASFNGDGGVTFTVTQANLYIICGLSADDSEPHTDDVNYALLLNVYGDVELREWGNLITYFPAYRVGDIFKIERKGDKVYYKKNGLTFYTSLVPSSGKLLVDTSIYTPGSVISDVRIFKNEGFPSRIKDLAGNGGNLEASLYWSAPANNGFAITGYDVQYGTTASGAFASVYSAGNVPGATIKNLENGQEYQFRVIAKNSAGASEVSNIVKVTPRANVPVIWTNAVGVNIVGNTITKTDFTNWGNGGASSVVSFNGSGAVEFPVAQINAGVMVGLSAEDKDASYNSIDYAVFNNYNGITYIYEKGTLQGSFGAYVTGDRFRVERIGRYVFYKKNGNTFYISLIPSVGKLLVDSAIYNTGGSIADAVILGFNLAVPTAIGDLQVVAANEQVSLTWSVPANNGAAITEYQVQYGTVNSGGFASVYTTTNPEATLTGLINGVEYQFRVLAKNSYGYSADSNIVRAIPQNSTLVKTDINTNTQWTLAGSPYLILGGGIIYVNEGATLTIDPGVEVKFDYGSQLQVNGTLNAQGTEAKPIVFTSSRLNPEVAWRGILFTPTSGNSVMKYTKLTNALQAIEMSGVSVPVSNSVLEKNTNGLLLTNNSSPLISGNSIRGNSFSGIYLDSGSSPLIKNNFITNNAVHGIFMYQTAQKPINPMINNNSFFGQSAHDLTGDCVVGDCSGLRINARNNWWGTTSVAVISSRIYDYTENPNGPIIDFSGYLNGPDGIAVAGEVKSGPLSADESWTAANSPYHIVNDITVKPGVKLTIDPGVEVRFHGNYKLKVDGTLLSQGLVNNLIKFTSGKEVVSPGDWQYLDLSSSSIVAYSQIEYANEGLRFDNTSPTIRNSIISHNNYGLTLRTGSSAVISKNTIINNNYGIYIYPELGATLNPLINFNTIQNNSVFAVYASGHADFSAKVIDAKNNWWGTTDLALIADKIYDRVDNPSSPLLNISPVATGTAEPQISNAKVSNVFFTPSAGQSTSISYTLDRPCNVTIRIYDFSPNQLVRTIINNQPRLAGVNTQAWDGKDNLGGYLPNDVYYYTITAYDTASGYGFYDPLYVSGTVQMDSYSLTPANFDPFKMNPRC
jgi:parallel beta-helix repeat protein